LRRCRLVPGEECKAYLARRGEYIQDGLNLDLRILAAKFVSHSPVLFEYFRAGDELHTIAGPGIQNLPGWTSEEDA